MCKIFFGQAKSHQKHLFGNATAAGNTPGLGRSRVKARTRAPRRRRAFTTSQPTVPVAPGNRIERAKEMLRVPRARVLDVAVACGFKTQQHLARVFRQVCGASPTEYRYDVPH